jgi:NADH oxidase (H2O2-forming)
MTERLIVIGGGGAGISAATTAKRVNPDLKVSLFTEFEDIAYSPCGIPFVHGGEIPRFEDLFLSTVERYVADGLDMHMETVVTDVDLDRGVVSARSENIGFDKLIVATGFTWEKPDVPGANLEGLHYVKNIRKAMEFDKLLDSIKRVVVVGATPLGVEMAGNLGQRGLEVHFVDEGPWVLHEVLDPDVAEPVNTSLTERGVQLHLGTAVEAFLGEGSVRAVQTSDGELECDVVIVCLHKMPNTALAQAAGLPVGTTGGLIVDDHMRTPRDGVWAAGDVIEVPHGLTMIPIRGLTGSHAYAQGRTAGANAAGDDRTYDPVWVPWGLVAGEYTIGGFSVGETLAQAMGIPYVLAKGVGVSRARYFPGATKTHVKLLAEPGSLKLVGGQVHGGEGVKERCDFLAFAAKRGATLEDLAWMENIYSPPIGALFEPIAIAAQNGLAELRKASASSGAAASGSDGAAAAPKPASAVPA